MINFNCENFVKSRCTRPITANMSQINSLHLALCLCSILQLSFRPLPAQWIMSPC